MSYFWFLRLTSKYMEQQTQRQPTTLEALLWAEGCWIITSHPDAGKNQSINQGVLVDLTMSVCVYGYNLIVSYPAIQLSIIDNYIYIKSSFKLYLHVAIKLKLHNNNVCVCKDALQPTFKYQHAGYIVYSNTLGKLCLAKELGGTSNCMSLDWSHCLVACQPSWIKVAQLASFVLSL